MLPFPGKFAFEGEIYFAMGLNISIKGKKKKNPAAVSSKSYSIAIAV